MRTARPVRLRRGGPLRLLAVLTTLGLVAAACGGDDGGDDGEAAPDAAEDGTTTTEAEGDPVYGGDLVYGVEADTQNGWTPQSAICAASCYIVFNSVYDTLVMAGEDGVPQPNLLESFEPNADYTEWTLTPRAGITFHDGTPFDAEAIRFNLQDQLDSSLTGAAIKSIEGVALAPDGAAAVVTMNESWSGFPIFLSSQLGTMASPTWLASTKAEPPTARATEPVGTGPFVFQEYEVGDHFTATKNEDYWKSDADGNQLPFLDSIEIRVLPDGEARINALESGQVDIAHTSSGVLIDRLRQNDEIDEFETGEFGETNYVLLNNDPSPESKGNPAVRDVNVRRALAMALDYEQILATQGRGVGELANGPFPPGSPGYLEDTGFPTYDPDAATELVEEYEAANEPIRLTFSTTNDANNLETAQIVQGFWNEVGIDTEIKQVEQGQFILDAAFGNFEAFTWRQHGGYDPDQQNVWWHTDSYAPAGGISLNFSHFSDPEIDAALDAIRGSDDPDERRELAETINRRFGEQVYNLWGTWAVWAMGHKPEVNGINSATSPDGVSNPISGGSHHVAQIWKSE